TTTGGLAPHNLSANTGSIAVVAGGAIDVDNSIQAGTGQIMMQAAGNIEIHDIVEAQTAAAVTGTGNATILIKTVSGGNVTIGGDILAPSGNIYVKARGQISTVLGHSL